MEVKPYKLKAEVIVLGHSKAFLYVCDPELNYKCDKTNCGKKCKLTEHKKFAKRFDIND